MNTPRRISGQAPDIADPDLRIKLSGSFYSDRATEKIGSRLKVRIAQCILGSLPATASAPQSDEMSLARAGRSIARRGAHIPTPALNSAKLLDWCSGTSCVGKNS